MGFNPASPRPNKKYLLIPEEDWILLKDVAHFFEHDGLVMSKRAAIEYKEILNKKYRTVEEPF